MMSKEPEDTTPGDWLAALQIGLQEITLQVARRHWPGPAADSPPYFNYRLEHVHQVERDALHLLAEVGGDCDILLAAVWLHDRFQPQFYDDQSEPASHARRAAQWASENLVNLGFPAHKLDPVVYAVANHSNPPQTIPEQAHEARLLWDADKLTKIGALNVVAYLCSNPAFPQNPVSFESVALRGLVRLPYAQERVKCFYFEPSRRLAQRRYADQEAFYRALAEQVGVKLE